MSKPEGTTAVVFPIGTPIEFYSNSRPRKGQVIDIRHIDTKKVIQRARVTGFEDHSRKNPQPLKVYEVRAVITETLK